MEKVEESSPLTQLKGELNELTDREKQLEPVLQLYEEVIELRREAEALKEDEDRAVRQVATGDVSSLYDGDVERVVGELEAAVENSYLQACWTKERQRYTAKNGTDLPEWWRVNLADLMPRLQDAKRLFERSNGTARDLYRSHEAKVNANTDARDKVKAEMLDGLKEEFVTVKGERERLQQIFKEQRFHLRRGTHVKQLPFTVQKQMEVLEDRVNERQNKLVHEQRTLVDEIADIRKDIEHLKRCSTDHQRLSLVQMGELKKVHSDAVSKRTAMALVLEGYELENAELSSLRRELQYVLHYTRVRERANGN
uniref:WGS project CAEQ00000000 data, annotated contig 1033 n=1 Tax=Trypanosoma congolense (strain IL3000) TaxID=1068625 RepID=F9W3B6_TRYCI|nr:unnamed protein product [Trypanosoma congolense IL3000]